MTPGVGSKDWKIPFGTHAFTAKLCMVDAQPRNARRHKRDAAELICAMSSSAGSDRSPHQGGKINTRTSSNDRPPTQKQALHSETPHIMRGRAGLKHLLFYHIVMFQAHRAKALPAAMQVPDCIRRRYRATLSYR